MELWVIVGLVILALTHFPAGALTARFVDPLANSIAFFCFWVFGASAKHEPEKPTSDDDRRKLIIFGWVVTTVFVFLAIVVVCVATAAATVYWEIVFGIRFWKMLKKIAGIKN